MNYEELYNQAMNGDIRAFEELKAGAEVGNPDAQYMLSCLYGNMDSPFYNEKQYDYWQKRIEQDTHIEPHPEKVPLNDYVPNWTFSGRNVYGADPLKSH